MEVFILSSKFTNPNSLLKTPTARRQTSWLFTADCAEFESGNAQDKSVQYSEWIDIQT